MMADKPLQLVPKLRFPEFRDGGEWNTRKFRDVVSRGKETVDPQKSSDIPNLIELENIESKTGRIPSIDEPKNQISLKSRFQAGDVLFGKLGPYLQKFARPDSHGVCTSEVWVPRSKAVSSAFLLYLVQTKRFVQLANISSGSRMPRAEWNYLANADFAIPHPDEQWKIADFLGSLDDLIAAKGRKLEALRQHKQGLMQQLFPQAGETVPRLRFPDFRDGPRWDFLTLASASDVNPSNDGLPELFIYIDRESVKSSMLIERKEVTRGAAPSRAQRLLSRKDIILQTVRPYQRNNFFFDISDGYKYVASSSYAQIRAHECPEFLYQLLHTDSFVNSVLARCTGSNYPVFNPSLLASIRVALPRIPEQKKIADCLSSLDDLIAAEDQKLEALRQHKQGLMPQMFPDLEMK
ncbi:MAG: restriction endonuclease subunit S [Albidovulum sp.]|nr:restriction endonuclease subunit S [Albidovulum sp.]